MNNIQKRIPLNGTFELTGRCNLSCKMCLVRVDQKRIQELELRERTADEWIHMAEQAAKAGTLGLLLTGGEVMIRPDFCEIYEAVAQMGFLLTVYTNATIVTNKVMDLFCKYPPHKIGVTMYGASNFQKAWENLPECYPKAKIIEACAACKYAPFCEVCPAIRKSETGDFFGIPDYFCREAKCMYGMLTYMDII